MADELPPIAIDSWNEYQSNIFGTQTDAQIATLSPPTSSDSLTNPIPRTPPDLAAGPPAPDSSPPPAQPAASDLPAPITAPLAPPQPTPDAPYTAPLVAGPTTGANSTPSPPTTANRPAAPAPSPINGSPDLIVKALNAADQAGVDPHLFVSLIQQESNFKPTARSPVGASGLSQLMPATAAGLGVTDPNDPDQSLMGGARYLKQQLDHFGGDVVKALAAYNAGPGAVDKYGGVPPYAETQSYVNSILGRLAAEQANGDQQPADQPDRAIAAASPFSQAPTKGADISQFGDKTLSTDEAYAACGPAAAVRFAEAYGRNPTLREATDMAKTVGWTSAQGMAGLDSEKSLMDKMGVATKVVRGPAWDAFSREAQTGNPVTISTQGHYFTADGFNPDTGAFHVGQSGLDLKHGSEWMTPAQMTNLMGPVQGGLLADNPSVQTPSTVTGTAGAQQSPLDALGQFKDQAVSAIGNAAQGAASAVSGAFRTSDSGSGLQSATGESYVGGAARPDQSTAIGQGVGNFLTQPQPFAENIVGAQTKQMQAGAGVSPYESGAQDLTPTEQYAQARGIATGLAQTLGPEDLAARATTAGAGSLASSGDAAVQLLYDRALGGGDPGPSIEALQGWLARAAQHPEVDQALVASKQAQLADLLKPPAVTAPANPFHLETTPGPNRELLTPQDAAAHLEDLNARHAANDSQIAQLEGQISSPSGKGEYKGIVRPNWAAGFTDGALARMAKDNGLNPYDPTWGQQARDIPGKAYYKNLNEAPQQTPAALRVQLASLRAENEQIATAAEHAVDADAAGQPLYRVNQPAPEELPWTSYTAPGDAASTASQNPAATTQAGRFGDSGAAPQGARATSASGTASSQGLAPNAGRSYPSYPAPPAAPPSPTAQTGIDLIQAGLDKARAEGRASPEQLDAMQAQIDAMKPPPAAGGSGGIPPAEPPAPTGTPPTGPQQRAPVTMDQVAPQGPLSRVTQAVNATFQPIENLPNGEVKDALKRYAAVMGSQSQGARVAADTAGRTIAESGPMFTAEGMPIESAAGARSVIETKARADLHGVLQQAGLSEATPEIKAILDNIHNPSAIATNPLGKVALGINSGIKGSLFGLSNMHNYTEALNSVVSGGKDAAVNYATAFVSPSFYDGIRYGSMAPDFDRAAMSGVTGLLHGGGGSDVQGLANIATRAVVGAIGGAGAGYEESLRAGDTQNAARNALFGGIAGAGAGVAAPALFGSMFGRAVPLAKVTVFKQLTRAGMPDLQAAAAVNRQFGGLNYAQMGRSATLQDAMRLMMTAPDWNEATIRSLGSAITGKGGGANFSRGAIVKAIAGPMIASEILSYVINGKSTFDNEPGHQFEVQIGTDKSGKGVYMGFMPGNYQAYSNTLDRIAGAPAGAARDIGSFATGRLGVLPQIGMDAATGSEYIGGPKAKNEAASLVSRAAPIGLSSVIQGLERGAPAQDILASLLAGPNLRYGSKAGQGRTPVAPAAPSISVNQAVGRYQPRVPAGARP